MTNGALTPPIRIVRADAIPVAIPFSHGAVRAGFRGQDWSKIFIVLVRLEAEDGLVGWGDAFAYNCWTAVSAAFRNCVAPLVRGRSIDDIPGRMRELSQILHTFGQNGVMQYALSGLDIALWDMKGKREGKPLRDIVGSGRRASVEGYSSLFKYGDPDIVRQKCRESLDEGFRSIKLHETTFENVKAAREACGNSIELTVDVNCPWTPAQALEAARAFRPLSIAWLEEPIYPPDDFDELAKLQVEGGIPIAAGENACGIGEFRRLIGANAATFIQPSVTKVGGVTEWLAIRDLCERTGARLRPHSPYFGPGFLATLQLAAACPGDTQVEWFKLDLEASLFGDSLFPKNGVFKLGADNGLGCDPDPDVVKDYAISADF